MANYRRCYIPGGSYFFTVVTERRAPILANDAARDLLRSAIRACQQQWPFAVDALVLLPDHLHAIWALPPDDADYSKRWGFIKKHFTQHWLAANGPEQSISLSKQHQRRRGVWQRRFWEHALRDERDYAKHLDYLHYNPVKHGLVTSVANWPYSSFHRFVNEGLYPAKWGSDMAGKFDTFDGGE
ncbi:REP-associated tyrosine transposase [Methylomonas sp. DH-1]|uniref:REP-associated tyrosine transposase n=1 Tax=Methylomonas sp. (strain DH-1) TaxID=1727196 RepID=UPI0007C91B8C|nr:transposase [Methylomonas sp. DH-1]ANE56413.1 transposase [Methylomonas sp. DH-1]